MGGIRLSEADEMVGLIQIFDGKIFINPMDNVIRIRTGEEGDSAV